jgi:hypothetical protein
MEGPTDIRLGTASRCSYSLSLIQRKLQEVRTRFSHLLVLTCGGRINVGLSVAYCSISCVCAPFHLLVDRSYNRDPHVSADRVFNKHLSDAMQKNADSLATIYHAR